MTGSFFVIIIKDREPKKLEFENINMTYFPLTLVSTNTTSENRELYMDTMRKYKFKDIEAAIEGKANYLAALGLSTYTEHLGGLYCGDLQNDLGDHYMSFINDYFPKCYGIVDTQLNLIT